MAATDDLQSAQEKKKSTRRQRDEYLAQKAREGDLQARETLITEHLYLVDRLLGRFIGKGVPTDVLYQEGCYGLILAVDRYDPKRNTLLDTYATYYVNKYLWQAMMDNYPHPIILKQKSAKWCKRYKEATEQLTERLGRVPSNQEIADELGISYQSAASLLFASTNVTPFEDIEDRVSADYSGRGAEEDVLDRLNEMCLDAFPVSLSPTEEEILYLRFGFGPEGKPQTFIEIAHQLHLSSDTVSKYYYAAIEKLRNAKQFP